MEMPVPAPVVGLEQSSNPWRPGRDWPAPVASRPARWGEAFDLLDKLHRSLQFGPVWKRYPATAAAAVPAVWLTNAAEAEPQQAWQLLGLPVVAPVRGEPEAGGRHRVVGLKVSRGMVSGVRQVADLGAMPPGWRGCTTMQFCLTPGSPSWRLSSPDSMMRSSRGLKTTHSCCTL